MLMKHWRKDVYKRQSKYKPLFVQVDEDELLDLQSKAMLPVEYTPENVQSLTQDMISSFCLLYTSRIHLRNADRIQPS